MTIFDDNFLWQFSDFWKVFRFLKKIQIFKKISDFLKVFRFFESFQIFWKFSDFLKVFVTWDWTLETLITFLTIENNNMNNYIVTFEYRVMVTAFAILAMFFSVRELSRLRGKMAAVTTARLMMNCSRGNSSSFSWRIFSWKEWRSSCLLWWAPARQCAGPPVQGCFQQLDPRRSLGHHCSPSQWSLPGRAAGSLVTHGPPSASPLRSPCLWILMLRGRIILKIV